jgi:hypothetical protein
MVRRDTGMLQPPGGRYRQLSNALSAVMIGSDAKGGNSRAVSMAREWT